MKKCTQCTQILSDDTKFCFKCGGGNFEPVVESGGVYQQPTYQQPPEQPPQQPYYAPQPPSYQQAPAYQSQPGYQAQASYNNNEPVTLGNFLLFFVLMLIPIFNIVYLIMVAVGGPKYKTSLTNFARASLIWAAIGFVIYIIVFAVIGASFASFNGYGYRF